MAVTVPNFLFALAVAAEAALLVALPRIFAVKYGRRFDMVCVEPPIGLPRFELRAIVPRVTLGDDGLAWLFGRL